MNHDKSKIAEIETAGIEECLYTQKTLKGAKYLLLHGHSVSLGLELIE